MLRSLYRRHLYVRIWLAVVGGVVILTLMANWIVRVAAEAERERLAPVPREVVVLDSQDRTIGTGARRSRSASAATRTIQLAISVRMTTPPTTASQMRT